jgi:hypothetical protein
MLYLSSASFVSRSVSPNHGDARRRRGQELGDELQHNTHTHTHTITWTREVLVLRTTSSFSVFLLHLLLEGNTAEIRIVPLLLTALSRVHPHARKCAHVRIPGIVDELFSAHGLLCARLATTWSSCAAN